MTQATEALPNDLAARVLITGLIDEFFARLDRGDSVEDLMESKATFKTHNRHAEGGKAIAELLLSLADMRKEKGRSSRHFGSNISIQKLEPGRYRIRSLVIVLSLDTQPTAGGVLNMGDHDDIVVIDTSGECRFESRTMSPVMQLGLSA